MTSQPGLQVIAKHVLSNISQSIFFFKNHTENEAGTFQTLKKLYMR